MLLPLRLQAAAERANAEVVLAWLDEGNDVNCEGENGGYNLLTATACGNPGNPLTEAHVALARELLRRGADPRLGSGPPQCWVPLHAACRGLGPASVRMVALLLGAGADANDLMIDGSPKNPLAWALSWFPIQGDRPALRAIISLLLRAGISLDKCEKWRYWREGGWKSAEDVLADFNHCHADDLPFDKEFIACKELVAGVRAAGSWREYIYRPRKQVLALRSLALRGGRAFVRPESPDAEIIRFIVNSPNEIAWKVLEYWRAGLGIIQPPRGRSPCEWDRFCKRQHGKWSPDQVSFEEARNLARIRLLDWKNG